MRIIPHCSCLAAIPRAKSTVKLLKRWIGCCSILTTFEPGQIIGLSREVPILALEPKNPNDRAKFVKV
jgi:hypothetical protein